MRHGGGASRAVALILTGCLTLVVLAGCGKPGETLSPRERALLVQLGSTTLHEQINAVMALADEDVQQASPAIRPLLLSGEPALRAASAEALGRLEDAAAAPALVGLLSDKAWEVRAAAATAVGQLAHTPATAALAAALHDDVATVRTAAARALLNTGEPGHAHLVSGAVSSNAGVRGAAITALGTVPNDDAFATVRAALADTAPAVRVAAVAALARAGDAIAVTNMIAMLGDDDRSVRKTVQRSLPRYGVALVPQLEGAIMSRNQNAVAGAVDVLGRIGEPECLPLLLRATAGGGARFAADRYINLQLASGRGVAMALALLQDPDTRLVGRTLRALAKAGVEIPTRQLLALLKASDMGLRLEAIRLLRGSKDDAVINELAALLSTSNDALDVAAAVALADSGDTRGADVLLRALSSSSTATGLRFDVIRALGQIREPRAVAPLLQLAMSPLASRLAQSNAAIRALGQIGDRSVVEPFLGILRKTHGPGRGSRSDPRMMSIAPALGDIGDPRAFGELTRIAGAHSHRMFHGVRDPMLAAAAKVDPERAVPYLVKAMREAATVDHVLYEHISDLLGTLGDPRGIEGIVIPLMSDINNVKQTAGRALVRMVTNNQACAEALVAHMEKAPADVRSSLAAVLAEAGAPVQDVVFEGLSAKAPEVRQGCAWAVGTAGNPAAVDRLIPLLRDSSEHVRGSAAWALARINDRRAVEPLLPLLNDPNLQVQIGAIDALGQLADTRALDPLKGLLTSTNRNVRASAVRALGMLGDISSVRE